MPPVRHIPRPGGSYDRYRSAEDFIRQANLRFRLTGWSSREVRVDNIFIEELDDGKWVVLAEAVVAVDMLRPHRRGGSPVVRCSREATGTGRSPACEKKIEAMSYARKAASTDGLKRALGRLLAGDPDEVPGVAVPGSPAGSEETPASSQVSWSASDTGPQDSGSSPNRPKERRSSQGRDLRNMFVSARPA